MATRSGGADRVSTKSKLAGELVILGRVLTAARERQGLKQAQLAERLGVPASYLSKVENGTRRLDVIELLQIARAMGTDAADLLADVESQLRRDADVDR